MRRRNFVRGATLLLAHALASSRLMFAGRRMEKLAEWPAAEARQGVAVDDDHFYAIDNYRIGKYDKRTGKRVGGWEGQEDGPVIHLDSGVVVDGRLYCGHSNYPGIPMTGSVEVWDTSTMQHADSHSFGIRWGSCTWIDRHEGAWWAGFAHYERFRDELGKDNRWTTVVRFDDRWRPKQSWIYPQKVLDRFSPMSNSGGSWGPDGLLYATGHDRPELYAVRPPRAGSTLELVESVPVDMHGQGIAWDRAEPGVLYTIKRSELTVGVHRLTDG